jgi:hypothetical protein
MKSMFKDSNVKGWTLLKWLNTYPTRRDLLNTMCKHVKPTWYLDSQYVQYHRFQSPGIICSEDFFRWWLLPPTSAYSKNKEIRYDLWLLKKSMTKTRETLKFSIFIDILHATQFL